MTDAKRELLRGFLDHAAVHLERRNFDAVREAIEDAQRLLRDEHEEVEW